MKIERKSDGKHAVVLKLSGNIQGGPDADLFQGKIQELVEEGRKHVLLDLAGVKWINSTGLGILIGGHTKLKKIDGSMKLVNMTDRIDNLFNVTKLKLVFEVFTDEVEALRSFKPEDEGATPSSS